MGQALYRKYRSKSLSEIIGQEHVTDTLERAIKSGKISHAYLLTGPRGVGKTSIARILAHEINNLPYTDESVHLDIIEIDAASNRRIDEIRDLRDKVHIAPTSAKYKVYIIDEVHMLTKEAFNALLKTLEEPPAHVIFILATTEAHKLPETIISRTQRFTFKPIEDEKTVNHLKNIAKKEGIKIDDEALQLLAEHGRGSFRDSIGLLDQIGSNKAKITKKDVEQLIGIAPGEAINSLLEATLQNAPVEIVKALDVMIELGIAPAQTAKQLATQVRTQLLNGKLRTSPAVATKLLAELLSISSAADPGSALELALFRAMPDPDSFPIATRAKSAPSDNQIDTSTNTTNTPDLKEASAKQTASVQAADDINNWWPDLVNAIKKHNNTLYGVLRMAHPELKKDRLRLSFAFGLHAKKVSDVSVMNKLSEAIKTLTGQEMPIEVVHDAELKNSNNIVGLSNPDKAIAKEFSDIPPKPYAELSKITSIFGGAEVLES